jgi:hypothetical protein
MGAKDREPRLSRYRGRSVVVLYNRRRPHSTFGGRTPDEVYAIPEMTNQLAA